MHELVERALNLAEQAHQGVKRKSGEPYITHPIAVKQILESWGVNDADVLSAALLHDTVEDTSVVLKDLERQFGPRVASLVDGVSKFGSDMESLKKLATRTFVDLTTGAIKLADRLHNMRTLQYMSEAKKIQISKETRDVFTRLAESMGMWVVKEELYDLAFLYLDPRMYEKISQEIQADLRTKPECYEHYKSKLKLLMEMSGIKGDVNLRLKGLYSTFNKRERLVSQGKCSPHNLKGVDDLVSLGVTVPTRRDCYSMLDNIHNDWNGEVLVNDFVDHIGNPSDNGYRGLKINIVSPYGPLEIVVMTEEMREYNDFGVIYRLRQGADIRSLAFKPIFLKNMSALFLPSTSTGVDVLAKLYPNAAVHHPQILVDGSIMPITTVIPTGATVEIVTNMEQPASFEEAMLNYCLPASRVLLEQVSTTFQEQQMMIRGQELFLAETRKRGFLDIEDLGSQQVNDFITAVDNDEGRIKSLQQLLYLLGGDFIDIHLVSATLDKLGMSKSELNISTIEVEGNENKPGILKHLIDVVNSYGGDIAKVHTQVGSDFVIRIVVKGLPTQAEEEISKNLLARGIFSQVLVV